MTSTEIFNSACKDLGYNPKTIIPDFSQFPENHQRSKIALTKIEIIIEAKNKKANKGKTWIPDFNNKSEYKYEPWFNMGDNEDGSSGFRYNGCVCWYSDSSVGSRLCYISIELCRETVKQIIDLYEIAYKW